MTMLLPFLLCASQVTTTSPGLQFLPSTAQPDDRLGADVAVDGNRLAVGAPLHDLGASSGADYGAIFVYRRDALGWTEEVVLDAAPGGSGFPDANLGASVGLDGDAILAGMPGFAALGATRGGAVVTFSRDPVTGWQREQVLTPATLGPDHAFGTGLDIDGTWAVATAPGDDTEASDAGAAYVLLQSVGSWTVDTRLTAPDGALQDRLSSCAISHETIVLGARFADAAGLDSGAAYVFERESGAWVFKQKLTASDGSIGDRFGAAVEIHGDRLAIGAPNAGLNSGGGPCDSGAVYVFDRDAQGVWSESVKFDTPEGCDDSQFGTDVSLSLDLLLVGAPRANVNIPPNGNRRLGACYLFEHTSLGWVYREKVDRVAPSISFSGEQFGGAIALSEHACVVGAPESRRVFNVFELEEVFPRTCDPAVATSSGLPASLDASGRSYAFLNEVFLECRDMPTQTVGYFVAGDQEAFVPGAGGSSGNLCIGGTVLRFDDLVLASGTDGVISRSLDVFQVPVVGSFGPGDKWIFQAWFRDGASSNFSNGVSISFR